MRIYGDASGRKCKKYWFRMTTTNPNYGYGIQKSDMTSYTLFNGDFIELTDLEVTANAGRPGFSDGTMVKVTEDEIKEASKNINIGGPHVSAEFDTWLALDDVEMINKFREAVTVGRINSRSVGLAFLELTKKENKPYQVVAEVEKIAKKLED